MWWNEYPFLFLNCLSKAEISGRHWSLWFEPFFFSHIGIWCYKLLSFPLAPSHQYCCFVSFSSVSFSFSSKYFLNSLLASSLAHILFRCVLFNFEIFVDFPWLLRSVGLYFSSNLEKFWPLFPQILFLSPPSFRDFNYVSVRSPVSFSSLMPFSFLKNPSSGFCGRWFPLLFPPIH